MSPKFILYAYPDYTPSSRRIHIYLHEKRLPETLVAVPKSEADVKNRGLPAKVGNFSPVMAVEKDDKPGEYDMIEQSVAIMEMLEDYCDAHPDATSVPSLRGPPGDIVGRAKLRQAAVFADVLFNQAVIHVCLGNTIVGPFHGFTPNKTVALELEAFCHKRALDPLERIIAEIMDYDSIANGKEGALTIAGIALLQSYEYCAILCGKDPLLKGTNPNYQRFVDACSQRKIIQHAGYPDIVKAFPTSWLEGVEWA